MLSHEDRARRMAVYSDKAGGEHRVTGFSRYLGVVWAYIDGTGPIVLLTAICVYCSDHSDCISACLIKSVTVAGYVHLLLLNLCLFCDGSLLLSVFLIAIVLMCLL